MNKVRVMVENGLWDIKCHKDEKKWDIFNPKYDFTRDICFKLSNH